MTVSVNRLQPFIFLFLVCNLPYHFNIFLILDFLWFDEYCSKWFFLSHFSLERTHWNYIFIFSLFTKERNGNSTYLLRDYFLKIDFVGMTKGN